MSVTVRAATSADREAVARMRFTLWPDLALEEHDKELDAILAGKPPSTMPLVIFVDETFRRCGVGRALVEAGMEWSRGQGCREFGSDTWLDAQHSVDAHERLGFEGVDRGVSFRRDL